MPTSGNTSFPRLFTEVDDLTRGDHHYLEPEDRCLFLGDFTARKLSSHSATNQLIFNFKKPMDRRGRPEWKYKGMAIREAAAALRQAFGSADLSTLTFVPVPPSKAIDDPLYDDRLLQMLQNVKAGLDIRELVRQQVSTTPVHLADSRPRPDELYSLYQIDESCTGDATNTIIICDDVLTTGCHFKAMKRIILERFPGAEIWGLFLARRVPDAIDFSDLDLDI